MLVNILNSILNYILFSRYDSSKGMESLETVWVSRANALQRKGLSGRVASGVCFHLFSGHRFEHHLRGQPIPGGTLTLQHRYLQRQQTYQNISYIKSTFIRDRWVFITEQSFFTCSHSKTLQFPLDTLVSTRHSRHQFPQTLQFPLDTLVSSRHSSFLQTLVSLDTLVSSRHSSFLQTLQFPLDTLVSFIHSSFLQTLQFPLDTLVSYRHSSFIQTLQFPLDTLNVH